MLESLFNQKLSLTHCKILRSYTSKNHMKTHIKVGLLLLKYKVLIKERNIDSNIS